MNFQGPIKTALIALLLALLGWLGYELNTGPTDPVVTNPVDTTVVVPTVPVEPPAPIYNKRGVVYTADADGLIQAPGAPIVGQAAQVFPHFRYMGVAERMYALDRNGRVEQSPAVAGPVQPCTNTSNVWACPTPSFREDLSRLVTLRSKHTGIGVYVAEWFAGKNWPAKMALPHELLRPDLLTLPVGSDQQKEQVQREGYEAARAVFASIQAVPGQWIVEPKNEWWSRPNLWLTIEWTRGYVKAHAELPDSIKQRIRLGLGPIAFADRPWQGNVLAESVLNYPADILTYLNETGGYWSYHFYPSLPPSYSFPPAAKVMDAPEWADLERVVTFRNDNYSRTRIYIGEWGYTSSPDNVLPTPAQVEADAPVIRAIEDRLNRMVDGPVLLYQIAEHVGPEGKFTGTAWTTNRGAFR